MIHFFKHPCIQIGLKISVCYLQNTQHYHLSHSNFIADQPLDAGLSQFHTIRKKRLANDRIIDDAAAAKLAEKVLDALHIGAFEIEGLGYRGGKTDRFPQDKALRTTEAQRAASLKWERENNEKITVKLRRGKDPGKDQIRAAAAANGQSVNEWIIEAIRDKL